MDNPTPPNPPSPPAPAPGIPPGTPPPYVPPAPSPGPAADAPEGPKYEAGGFLKQFDWVEIGFLAMGAFAIYHIITYYRKKAKDETARQGTMADVQSRLDQAEKKLNAIGNARSRRI